MHGGAPRNLPKQEAFPRHSLQKRNSYKIWLTLRWQTPKRRYPTNTYSLVRWKWTGNNCLPPTEIGNGISYPRLQQTVPAPSLLPRKSRNRQRIHIHLAGIFFNLTDGRPTSVIKTSATPIFRKPISPVQILKEQIYEERTSKGPTYGELVSIKLNWPGPIFHKRI